MEGGVVRNLALLNGGGPRKLTTPRITRGSGSRGAPVCAATASRGFRSASRKTRGSKGHILEKQSRSIMVS